MTSWWAHYRWDMKREQKDNFNIKSQCRFILQRMRDLSKEVSEKWWEVFLPKISFEVSLKSDIPHPQVLFMGYLMLSVPNISFIIVENVIKIQREKFTYIWDLTHLLFSSCFHLYFIISFSHIIHSLFLFWIGEYYRIVTYIHMSEIGKETWAESDHTLFLARS